MKVSVVETSVIPYLLTEKIGTNGFLINYQTNERLSVTVTNSEKQTVRHTITDGKVTIPFDFLTDGELKISTKRRDATHCEDLVLYIETLNSTVKSATANIYAIPEYISSILKMKDNLLANIRSLESRLDEAETKIAEFEGRELF